MYHAIVKRQYARAWKAMNAHDFEVIVGQFAPRFRMTFIGDTCLGGTRTTRASMTAWFERLFRLFPDARFEMRDVAVSGPPWRTRVAGLFTLRATVLGEPYENVFTQFVTLRYGRIAWYEIYEDSLRFARMCERIAPSVPEALAAPIVDGV